MNSIEQNAIENYMNNMQWLKKYHNETFHKVDIFQNGIEKGYVEEKYTLEYLNDGYFDIQEIQSNQFLYAQNSQTFSQELTDILTFKKNNYSFQGFRLVHNFETANLNDASKAHEGLYPIMTYYLDHYPYETTMKKIDKFIFIGVGLGLHLPLVDEKIDAERYFIIEDDIELFRLSLFTTPYYKTFQEKKVTFALATNEVDFINNFKNFLEMSFYLNRLIKYSYFPAHSQQKIQMIKNALTSQNFVLFGYNVSLKKFLKPLDLIQQEYKFLNLSQPLQLGKINDKPLLVIGAGPSLQENIEWLQEHQNSFIIYAVATSVKTLYKHNIKPDIVSHIDGFEAGYKNFEGFPMQEFVKDSIAILGSFVEQRVIDLFNKRMTFMLDEDTFYFQNFSSITAPCIGSSSIINSLMLGFKDIYLLGLDLALAKDGSTHSKEHATKSSYDVENADIVDREISLRNDVLTVKGNFAQHVYTTPLFHLSIISINNLLRMYKQKNQNIYNLNDGAFFKNTIPLQTDSVPTLPSIDKKAAKNGLLDALEPFTASQLSKEDLTSLEQRLQYAQKSVQIIKKYIKSVSYDHTETYLYNIYGLIMDLYPETTRENKNLTKVFDLFFQYAVPILYDMCNTKEKEDSLEKDLKEVDKMVTDELLNIAEQYVKRIEQYLKEKS